MALAEPKAVQMTPLIDSLHIPRLSTDSTPRCHSSLNSPIISLFICMFKMINFVLKRSMFDVQWFFYMGRYRKVFSPKAR